MFDRINRTRTNISLVGYIGENKAPSAILGIYPDASSPSNGIAMMFYVDRTSEYFGLSQDKVLSVFGPQVKGIALPYPKETYFFDDQHLEELVGLLRSAKEQHNGSMSPEV